MRIGLPVSFSPRIFEDAFKFKNMGADYLELNLSQPLPDEDELLDRTEQVERISLLPIVHLPEINYTWQEIKALKEIIEMISSSSSYRRIFVMHFFGGERVSLWQKRRAFNEILKTSREYDVPIALENKFESRNVFKKVFQIFPELYMCFDVGHAHLYFPEAEILQFIKELSDRIIHLHVHDNFGGGSEEWDLHLPLGMGSTDFKPLLEEAAKCPRLRTITMEVLCLDDDYIFLSLNKLKRMMKQKNLERKKSHRS